MQFSHNSVNNTLVNIKQNTLKGQSNTNKGSLRKFIVIK